YKLEENTRIKYYHHNKTRKTFLSRESSEIQGLQENNLARNSTSKKSRFCRELLHQISRERRSEKQTYCPT
ncbi:hypothetical protein SK128_001159, partial [Halocaridina rubra]